MTTSTSTSTSRATLERFEEGSLDLGSFRHADHVRLAWELIRRDGVLDGLAAFESGLRRLTAEAGLAERFNTTITYALFFLIAERVEATPVTAWEEFAARNPDLLAWPSPALDALYAPEILATPLARTVFVLPRPARARA